MAAARAAPAVALDTEFLRERTYRARLCLVQMATRDEIWLIDPTTGTDLSPIAGVLADPEVEVIVHAGKQDLEIFHDLLGVVPTRVFDVQLAAGFAGFGANLPYGRLVELVIGARISKGESYSDWCRRPLTEAQLSYAADDVRYLLEAAQRIRARIDELGRTSWVEEEMAALSQAHSYGVDLDEVYRRVTGRGTLSGRQVAVLREVARWREQEAARRDVPRGWIVKDPTLVEIARRGPETVAALKQVRGMNPKIADRSGRDIIECVKRGKDAAVVDAPRGASRQIQARARMLSGLADAIVRARCDHAQIATELVATRGELEGVLADVLAGSLDPAAHRLLKGWRRELAGEAVLALAEGRIAVKATDEPPYVEEILL